MDSLVRFSEINQAKTFEFNLTLSKEQNLQLIKRLDLLSLKKVSFKGSLSPLAEDRWALKAELRATVKQKADPNVPNGKQRVVLEEDSS